MFKNIKKKFTTKAVLYFILVVALLIITVDQKNKINNLQAEVSGLIDIGETIENQIKDQLVRMEVLRQNAKLDDSEVDRHIQSDSNWLSTYNLYANSGNGTVYRDQIRGQLSCLLYTSPSPRD